MRISTEQLGAQLTRDLQPLYCIHGEEALLSLEAADRLRAKARKDGYVEREVLTVEPGFKWSELAMTGSAQSLFASRKLLELRIPNGKPGVEGAEAIQAYCARLPEETITLITLPGIDWRAQKSAWFEALDRAGVVVEAKTVVRKALPGWLAGRLKEQGQSADEATLAFLSDRVEGNLLAAHQEVQKLGLLYPAGPLTFDMVRDAVLDVSRFDVFGLGEALLQGDPVRIDRMLDGLKAEGAALPLMTWMLSDELRMLGRLLGIMERGVPVGNALREARVFPMARQNLVQQHVQRFSRDAIVTGLQRAARIDRMVKGLDQGDPWNEVLQLMLSFARMPETRVLRRPDAPAGSALARRAAAANR